jgi:hypothetical protein
MLNNHEANKAQPIASTMIAEGCVVQLTQKYLKWPPVSAVNSAKAQY